MTGEFWVFAISLAVALSALLLGQLWPQAVAAEVEGDVIRALALAIPIFGSFCLWLLKEEAERRREETRRDKRRERLLIALRAEIEMQLEEYIEQFGPEVLPVKRQSMRDAIRRSKKSQHSMPVGVVPAEHDVFDNIKSELPDLPSAVIKPVIQYYQADEYVEQLIKAFSAGAFEKKSVENRLTVFEGYIYQGLWATLAGFDAIEAIDGVLSGKPTCWTSDRDHVRNFIRREYERSPSDAPPVSEN